MDGSVILYCPEEVLLQPVLAALPDGVHVMQCAEWAPFERMLIADACGLIVVRWLERDPDLPGLRTLYSRRRAPLVLVTSKDADNARALKDLAVEEVVWLSDPPAALGSAIHAALSRRPLLMLSDRLDRDTSLDPALRAALVAACRQRPPPTTVAALAGLVGVDRRVLWRAWRKRFGPAPP